jgi:hypothetical protein
MESVRVLIETITYKHVFDWIQNTWAKSLAAVVMFCVGIAIGQVQTESRVIGDCKYAGAFRVAHEAFVCQRRI